MAERQKNPRLRTTGDFRPNGPRIRCRKLVGLADDGLGDQPGAQAAGAHGNGADFAVGELMAHVLKVGVEHALGFDVGMADIVAGLGLLAAKRTLLGHGILHIFGRSPETIFLQSADCPHQRLVFYTLRGKSARGESRFSRRGRRLRRTGGRDLWRNASKRRPLSDPPFLPLASGHDGV